MHAIPGSMLPLPEVPRVHIVLLVHVTGVL
jgi:hypothetical protein